MTIYAKEIRIKPWWLIKNNMYASCPAQIREGRYTGNSWLLVTKETEKAYHLNEMQMYIYNPWIPKSAVIEVRDVEQTIENGVYSGWMPMKEAN